MRLRVARKLSSSWRCKPLRRCLAWHIKQRRYMRGQRHKYPELWQKWCHFAERRVCLCNRRVKPGRPLQSET